ncbi:MAG: hypothetical protein A2X13_08965 [Bacteroidetes bacterium GWC2_33_15]|nr:MAG: hypothetical protein A2X10_01595 [Bacteroidetes bacterium GWA2_33_15]OFX49082.1 MAG: hypothetical protein A2X13_08965 [Bacteroidetes bacterium GWC2_33_15]OFX64851.1 MAG: hypothetical protein A2X15_05845 [Bacteroidetes bacterium GWB2_32_14]OFX68559.1 MAG: hypothetical protein A2X14_14410 [Bacteroidetes bacterium GWD2_33_33]
MNSACFNTMNRFIYIVNRKLNYLRYSVIFLFPVFLFGCKTYQVPQNQTNNYTSQNRKSYIENYKDLAIREMKRCGIPASITLAQAMLESDNGNSTLARKANNHFGIKCHNGWNGEKIYHDDDRRGECFRKYNTVYESYHDHSDFIANGSRYQFLFDHDKSDYKAWAKGLQRAGYATSNTYAGLLIKIIEDNQLYLFDYGKDIDYSDNTYVDTQKVQLGDIDNFKINVNKHQVLTKNRIEYIIVKKGDTFKTLTDEFQKISWELPKYNEIPEDAVLAEGQIIYLQPKRNKAEYGSDFHEVKEGETMYSISQLYGIKLNSLYEKNLMEKGTEPKAGQKIWLRKLKTEFDKAKETPIITDFDSE